MVDVSYSPEPTSPGLIEDIIPEDNVERLRNIRDMFENSNYSEELILQKVEKLQPSEKLIDRLTNEIDLQDMIENSNNTINSQLSDPDCMMDLIYLTNPNNNNAGVTPASASVSSSGASGGGADMHTLMKSDLTSLSSSNSGGVGATTTGADLFSDDKFEASVLAAAAAMPSSGNLVDLEVLVPSSSSSTSGAHDHDHADSNNNKILTASSSSSSSSSGSVSSSSMSSPFDMAASAAANAAANQIMFASTDMVESQTTETAVTAAVPPAAQFVELETTTTTTTTTATIDKSNDDVVADLIDITAHTTPNDDVVIVDDFQMHARFEEGGEGNEAEEEEEEENEEERDGIVKNRRVQKKKDVIPFAELNNVKTKFEKYGEQSTEVPSTPKPMRSITPPREGANTGEIENQPMQLPEDVVSGFAKIEDKLPDAGYARSRKELFDSIGATESNGGKSGELPRVKSITPPREDALKRVLKETTPERNENVIRESDRSDDILPTAGHIKNTAAIFASGRQKSIERSGITLEGELLEKGIAKQRLALFSDPSALNTASHAPSTAELESEYIKNVSGIAKERLNMFKTLEQGETRTSPSRELKKLKEFTPPPQLDHQQRQYIIINEDDQSDKSKEAFQDEALAAIGKGHAKSALARFEQSVAEASSQVRKSTTPPKEFLKAATTGGVKTVFESQPMESNVNAQFIEEDIIPSAGNAKSLKDKFLTLEKEATKIETSSAKMTYVPKKFTAPSSSQPAQKKGNSNGLLTTAPQQQQQQASQQQQQQQQNAGEKCCVCEKTVYAMEKIEADKKVYHKTCFKCTSCNCPLNDTTDIPWFVEGKPYCRTDGKKIEQPSPQASPKKTAKPPMEAIKVDTTAAAGAGGSKSPAAKSPAAPAAASPSKKAAAAAASPAKSPKK